MIKIDKRFLRKDIDTYEPKFFLLMEECKVGVVRFSEELLSVCSLRNKNKQEK